MVKPRPAAVSQADKLRRFKYLEVTTLANKLRKRLREDTIKPAPILLTPPQVQCKKCPGCLHKTCGECKACKQKQRCTAPERRCTRIPDDILSCTLTEIRLPAIVKLTVYFCKKNIKGEKLEMKPLEATFTKSWTF